MSAIVATVTGGSVTDRLFVQTAFDEAAKWIAPLLLGSATLEYSVTLKTMPPGTVAECYGMQGIDTGTGFYTPGTVAELASGIDPNGSEPDAFIDVDVVKLAASPNAIVTMMHEITHGISFNGSADVPTLFTEHIQGGHFVGTFADDLSVPLFLGNHYAMAGLMNPFVGSIPFGNIDAEILADSGVPIVHVWETASVYVPVLVG